MNSLEIDLLAGNEEEVAELSKFVAAFVRAERRLPGYEDLVRAVQGVAGRNTMGPAR
jgi:hypothetical protein